MKIKKIILMVLLTLVFMIGVTAITPQNSFDFRNFFNLSNVDNITTNDIRVDGKEVCLADGTNCPASGSGGQWNITGSIWIINNSGILDWNETLSNLSYWNTDISLINESFANLTYVNVDGDTMSGVLDMGGNQIDDTVIQCSNVTKTDGDFCLMNTTIDAKIASTTATFIPTNISTRTGTVDDGNLTSIQVCGDNNFYNVSEVSGSPGFDIRVNFTNVNTEFNSLNIRELYEGGGGHTIHLRLWNFNTSSWNDFGTFSDMAEMEVVTKQVFDDDNYKSGGIVMLWIDHDDTGITAHNLFIDCIFLGFSSGGVSSGVGGSGTVGTIPRWITGTRLSDSLLTQTSNTITMTGNINTTGNLTINSNNKIVLDEASNMCMFSNTTHIIISNNLTGVTC